MQTEPPKTPAVLPENPDTEQILQWLEEQAPFMQDENGIDLGHIRENLERTPRERLERAEKGAAGLLILRRANPKRI